MIQAIIFSNNYKYLNVFLESLNRQDISFFEIHVLYSCEDSLNNNFLQVLNKYKVENFKKETNFKEDLISLINLGSYNLISFFKDTNYFFAPLPQADIEQIMSDDDIFCFSLGLGRNIKQCYSNSTNNILLNEIDNGDNTLKWNWVKHYLDFGRPLELGAGHIFHKKEIQKLFKKWQYENILGLEASFDNLDYYPKESMSSFKHNVLVDVVYKEEEGEKTIQDYDFSSLDKITIEI